jgi:hypothetical protein
MACGNWTKTIAIIASMTHEAFDDARGLPHLKGSGNAKLVADWWACLEAPERKSEGQRAGGREDRSLDKGLFMMLETGRGLNPDHLPNASFAGLGLPSMLLRFGRSRWRDGRYRVLEVGFFLSREIPHLSNNSLRRASTPPRNDPACGTPEAIKWRNGH